MFSGRFMDLEQRWLTMHHSEDYAAVKTGIVDFEYECDLAIGQFGNLRCSSHAQAGIMVKRIWARSEFNGLNS